MSTIDVVGQAADGTVLLVLLHNPETATVDGLQERVHATVSYALDGQLAEAFPDLAGQPVSIQLDLPSEPTGDLAYYVDVVRPRLAGYGIGLIVRVENTA